MQRGCNILISYMVLDSENAISRASFVQVPSYRSARRQMNHVFCSVRLKDVRAHCYCASLLRTLFIKHARATSFSSARTESKTQQKHRAGDLGVNLMCQYFCWMPGDPPFFFGRSLPFLILSIILKNKKNLCVGSFNYF